MCTKRISVLVACVSVLALGLVSGLAGSASAATLKATSTALVAVYGNPGSNGTGLPVGGGLGRNFGFGQNILFQAGNGVGEALSITVEPGVTEEAKESYIGGTLLSNKTGANNPLSLAVQFVDFQDGTLAGYSDTYDRPWMTEICPEAATTKECRVDSRFTVGGGGAPESTVKVEDASFNLGPGTTIQGTVWGAWVNGTTTTPACIKLNLPPKEAGADQTLIVSQSAIEGVKVGAKISAIRGEACIVSSNNNYWKVGEAKETPAITIANE